MSLASWWEEEKTKREALEREGKEKREQNGSIKMRDKAESTVAFQFGFCSKLERQVESTVAICVTIF